ncbi:hypothetical protein DB29_04338 [Shouchella clausii]|nr:hypothetical protein DB29_04338 [Shouchella clausii]
MSQLLRNMALRLTPRSNLSKLDSFSFYLTSFVNAFFFLLDFRYNTKWKMKM